jgi:hypothetical protein
MDRGCRLKLRNIVIRPDDVRTVAAVRSLDTLAWIASNLAERIDGMGQDAGESLHSVISGARFVSPLVAPLPNDGPNFVGPVELRNA